MLTGLTEDVFPSCIELMRERSFKYMDIESFNSRSNLVCLR